VASKDVADVIARFDEVDIAIVGIGILEPSQLLKTSGNYYHEDMLQVLAERGAVGTFACTTTIKTAGGVTR
jgi:DNA-binding transcriptional regulator LsrR (DeoR family)